MGPRYVSESGDFAGGLDVKRVFRDSLVLDATVNPDFSQVESDEPQVTVNERFEVFFPEKRPFFLENASFFETPINLFFSRRIVDPKVGGRVTGRAGPYSIGALYADDRAAGSQLLEDDPAFGEKTRNAVFRLSRDMGNQSSLGLIYTESRLDDSHNRVGGLDGRIRFGSNWVGTLQGVASSTRAIARGPGRPGRSRTRALFLRRDFRGLRQTFNYRFRPEGKVLVAWGPDVTFHPSWRHDGSALDTLYSAALTAELPARSFVGAFYTGLIERLRPDDAFPDLLDETRYSSSRQGVFLGSSYNRSVTLSGEYAWGTVINLVPPEGFAPALASSRQGNFNLTWFASRSIRLEGAYLFSRVSELSGSRSAFDNHIVRGRLSWRPTQRLTLRSIVQYDSLLTDPSLTSLETAKNLNVDLLATYLVNPWTALYVGYNNNQNNPRLMRTDDASELVRTDRLGPDSWQFFVKASYLFRF